MDKVNEFAIKLHDKYGFSDAVINGAIELAKEIFGEPDKPQSEYCQCKEPKPYWEDYCGRCGKIFQPKPDKGGGEKIEKIDYHHWYDKCDEQLAAKINELIRAVNRILDNQHKI